MKHRLIHWVAWLLVCVGLVACGSDPGTGTAPTAATRATEPASPTDAPSDATPAAPREFTFGMVLVGPINDGGWNQAHYDAAQYVVDHVPSTKFIYIDKVNPADKPNVTVQQVADELISQGAQFVITNSAEFADGTIESAKAHPDVTFLHASGDSVLTGSAPPNMGNLMGRMEYGKMIAGCAAALQSETGKLSYLGPLIDSETRRLVNSTYLGARYCWETLDAKPADQLSLEVTWIGFWFNIPGVTLDPTKVADDFINAGSDVIVSGIDTTEALVQANKATEAGNPVFAVPYDFRDACDQAPQVCLGVPYFNWGPFYVDQIQAIQAGTWQQAWDWVGPDWSNINDPDRSIIGFTTGPALSEENQTKLQTFIAGLADGSISLFSGPLNYQDGSPFIADGEVADDRTIWYTEQLLEGIKGQSAPQ